MKIDRLFQVVVVAGAAATTGLMGCSGSDDGDSGNKSTGGSGTGASSSGGETASGGAASGGAGTGGAVGTGGDVATGGTVGTGGDLATGGTVGTGGEVGVGGTVGTGGSGDSCEAVCQPNETVDTWTDCNGCCCWLPAGQSGIGVAICGADEGCCVGRGR